eukprot:11170875-Alexandrium_andersonii.AAC.1
MEYRRSGGGNAPWKHAASGGGGGWRDPAGPPPPAPRGQLQGNRQPAPLVGPLPALAPCRATEQLEHTAARLREARWRDR